jgi:hypothetical protein
MPKVSKDSSALVENPGPLTATTDEMGEWTVNFLTLHADIDISPLVRGLPDDRCQCPHLGYVIKGRLTFRYPDHDEVVEAGEAFYAPPGHAPIGNEPETVYVQFSPTHDIQIVGETIKHNMEAMQPAG